MSSRVFLDSDILLDVLAARKPFYEDSATVLYLAEMKRIEAFTTPLVISNLYYILRKLGTKNTALTGIRKLRSILQILPMNAAHIDKALSSKFSDFEDALQYFASQEGQIDFIVTRNKSDYKTSKIAVCRPNEFLKIFRTSS